MRYNGDIVLQRSVKMNFCDLYSTLWREDSQKNRNLTTKKLNYFFIF